MKFLLNSNKFIPLDSKSAKTATLSSIKNNLEDKKTLLKRGGFSDWWDNVKEHPVRSILIGLLVILIIVIFVLTGGKSWNSRDGVQ